MTTIHKPTFQTEVNSRVGTALLAISAKVYQKLGEVGIVCKAPNINEFPGDFNDTPTKVTATIEIKSKFNEFHCTGYYMVAGTNIEIEVLEGNVGGWEVRIGGHTDDLSSMDNGLKRWPVVTVQQKLRKMMRISSAFGGIVYLDSPNGLSVLKLKLVNVVETPFLDLKNPDTLVEWQKRRLATGLWAEVCGRFVVFCVPAYVVRGMKIEELVEALTMWDRVVVANHELRGTDVRGCARERVVVDVQPFDGRMHAGYPIVVPYCKCNLKQYFKVIFKMFKLIYLYSP